MGLSIKLANLLMFEAEATPEAMRIAMPLLREIKRRVNVPFEGPLAELREKELVPAGDIEDVMHEPGRLEHPFVQEKLAAVSQEHQFYVNTDIYYDLGWIPGDLARFRQVYKEFAKGKLPVVFFNTAGAEQEYEVLAGSLMIGEMPALADALWVVTDCPFGPMPDVFREMVDKKKVRHKGQTTISDASSLGGAYTTIITDRPGRPEASLDEAAEAICRRLMYLRAFGAL